MNTLYSAVFRLVMAYYAFYYAGIFDAGLDVVYKKYGTTLSEKSL